MSGPYREPEVSPTPTHAPIILDPSLMRPLPQSLWGISCEWCDKRQARWELFLPDMPPDARKGLPVCSLCWLYESYWGEERRTDIDLLVEAVETEISQLFEKRSTGELLHCRDADRILGAVGVTSRIFAYHGAMSRTARSADGA